MVADAAAVGHEVVQSGGQSGLQTVQRIGGDARHGGQLRDGGLVQTNDAVGTEGGSHLGAPVHTVSREIRHGIVCGGDVLHLELLQKIADMDIRQLGVCLLTDALGGIGAQRLVDTEDQTQLHLGPVVQRVARKPREDLGVFRIFLREISVARDVLLVHAAHPHGAPLVVVAPQPKFTQVGEAAVGLNLLFVEMTMVINDG